MHAFLFSLQARQNLRLKSSILTTWADPEGGGGGGEEKSQYIEFLSNTGPDPLKDHKATKPAFNVGPSSARREMPFKWHVAGGLMITHL